MQCRICRKSMVVKGNLCPDCRSALQRARDDTVSGFLPVDKAEVTRRRAKRPKPAAPAARLHVVADGEAPAPDYVPEPVHPPPSPRKPWLWLTGAALLLAAGLFLVRSDPSGVATEASAAAPQSASPAPVVSAGAEASTGLPIDRSRGRASPALSGPAPVREPVTANAGGPGATETVPVPPPVPDGNGTLATPKARAAAPRARSAPVAPVESQPAAVAEIAQPLPRPATVALAAAPVPADPRAVDRWQQLQSELTRCGGEPFFSRVVCEQRVRLQYCEGYWGRNSHCPAAVQNDHGQ